MRNTDWSQLRG